MLPLPEFLVEILAAYLTDRRTQLGRELAASDPLFVNSKGRPINIRTFRVVMKRRLRALDLPADFRAYDLRHSHASQLIDEGASPLAVQERMGHADILTTFRTYGHLFEGVQQRLAGELDRLHVEAMKAKAQLPAVIELDDRRKAKRRAARRLPRVATR